MDVRHYKLATPVLARIPGRGVAVHLRPLPPSDCAAAELAAGRADAPRTQWRRHAAELVARAITPTASATDLLSALEPAEMAALYAAHLNAQDRAHVRRWDLLHEWARKSVCDHSAVLDDAIAAWQTESAGGYYGLPMVALTPAQISWHSLLRAAFREFYVDEPRRHAGAAWLASDRDERMLWQIPD